jgi:argininosuccinate lyase
MKILNCSTIYFIFRSVEDVNQEVSREFHLAFVQNVAYMEDSLNRFVQDLMKFCSGLQTNLGMYRT